MRADSSVSISSWQTRRTDSRIRSSPSPDWKAASSSDRTDWSRAIGVYSFAAFGQEHTEDHAAGPLMGGPSDSLQTPPLWGTLPKLLLVESTICFDKSVTSHLRT